MLKYYTLFGFFVIGVVTVLLGQILPILAIRLELNDAQAGVLLSAQFSGALLGTLLIGRLIRRFGFVGVALLGLALIMAGLPAINAREFIVCWIGIFFFGAGIGFAIPATNLLTIEMTDPSRQTSAVNLLNFCWGVGAICSRPFVTAVSHDNSLITLTVMIESALLLLAISFLSARHAVGARSAEPGEDVETVSIWRQPAAWLFVVFGFFAVGVEGGVSGWLTTYSESLRLKGVNQINVTVVYFIFFVLGRGIAAIASRRASENALISVCSVFLVAGVLMIVISESLALPGAAIAGLGSSALFPTNMVRFAKIFGPTATRNAMPMFFFGTSGAAVVSTSVGFVSYYAGSLRSGLAVILLSAAMVVVMQMAIVMTFRRGGDS